MAQYYILHQGKPIGPLSKDELLRYGLTKDSYVWEVGTSNWVKASDVDELKSFIPPTPPRQMFDPTIPPSIQYNSFDEVNNKKIVSGILAILLGCFGIHYFYLGKPVAGIITIVLSMVSCGIWSLIMFIQGILMLVMPTSEFEAKFMNPNKSFPVF